MRFISYSGSKRRWRACRRKRLQGRTCKFLVKIHTNCTGDLIWNYTVHISFFDFVNLQSCHYLVLFLPGYYYTFLLLIPVLGSQGDIMPLAYTKGPKGVKGQQGPEVRQQLPFLPLILTFESPCLIMQKYKMQWCHPAKLCCVILTIAPYFSPSKKFFFTTSLWLPITT